MKITAASNANETILVDSLTSLVKAASAAELLADPAKMKKMKWAELQLNIQLVEKYGCEVSANVARSATRKYAEILLDQEKFDEWLLVACPWKVGDETSTDVGGWTLAAPRMWKLTDCPDEKEKKDLHASFLGCFFNDTGMRMLMNVTNGAPAAVPTLVLFVHKFLSARDDWATACLVEGNDHQDLPCLTSFVSVCRGFSALLHPIPAAYSAHVKDANFVLPGKSQHPTTEGTMMGLLPPASTVMFSHIRDSEVWQSFSTTFVRVAAMEKMLAPKMTALCDELASTDTEGWTFCVDVYGRAVQLLTEIRGQLRPGATALVEEALVKALARDSEQVQDMATTTCFTGCFLSERISILEELRNFFSGVGTTEAKIHLQKANEALGTWRAANTQAALEEVSRLPMTSEAHVDQLLAALKAGKNTEIPESLAQQFCDTRNLLHKFLADTLANTDLEKTTPKMFAKPFEALDLLHGLKAVAAALGPDDSLSQVAAKEVAQRILNMRLAVHKGQSSQSLPSILIVALDECTKAHSSFLASHRRWSKGDAGLSQPSLTWIHFMLDHGQKVENELSTFVGTKCSISVSASAKHLRKVFDTASDVAGGHPSIPKACWTHGFDDASPTIDGLLAHAETTLLCARGEFIDNCKKELQVASS